MTLMASAADLDSLKTMVTDLQPEVAVTEINMPELAWGRTIEWISDHHPPPRVSSC